MSLQIVEPTLDSSSIYLQQLEELISEMSTGIQAIASHSLGALRKSVARQEELCTNLANTRDAGPTRLSVISQSIWPQSDDDIEQTIWQASNTIRQLNLQYDELLKYSSKTATMLSSLYSCHFDKTTVSQHGLSQQHTWSCNI